MFDRRFIEDCKKSHSNRSKKKKDPSQPPLPSLTPNLKPKRSLNLWYPEKTKPNIVIYDEHSCPIPTDQEQEHQQQLPETTIHRPVAKELFSFSQPPSSQRSLFSQDPENQNDLSSMIVNKPRSKTEMNLFQGDLWNYPRQKLISSGQNVFRQSGGWMDKDEMSYRSVEDPPPQSRIPLLPILNRSSSEPLKSESSFSTLLGLPKVGVNNRKTYAQI